MANTDKDILISPNRGSSTADPSIRFTGGNASVAASVNVSMYADGTLSFDGTAGQLFSITNSLTGTIFSVNDISGIPSIEVTDSGIIRLAQYNGNVGIGTATVAAGNVLSVYGGNVFINGSVTGTTIIPTGSTAPTNGMYLPAANTLGLATNSTEKLRIDSGGNVGIGTSSPTSLLHAVQSSNVLKFPQTDGGLVGLQLESGSAGHAPSIHLKNAAGYYRIAVHSTDASLRFYNGTDRMTILQSGSVGIGTTTISAGNALAVFGGNIYIGTTGSSLRFPDGTMQTTAASGASISVTNDTTTNASTYYPSLTNNVTSGTLGALVTSSTKLFYNPSTGALNSSVFIPSGSTAPTNGMFLPAANSVGWATNSLERMRIDANGNVGIGTASTISTGNVLAVYGGNILIGTTGSSIRFPDGTMQTTAAPAATTPAGSTGAVQYKTSGGAFGGDSSNFYYDSTNHRLAIGSSDTTTTTLTVVGSVPSLFNTTNGNGDQQIIAGTSTTLGATLGYNPSSVYGYVRTAPAGSDMLRWNSTGVGINATTPYNTLDVNGKVVIGTDYMGGTVAPTNGLLVQGAVGIGTATTVATNKLSVYGGNLKIGTTGNGLLFADGTYMSTAATGGSSTAYAASLFTYTGDGTTTTYSTSPLSYTNINNTSIYISGVYQRKSTYSWGSTTITFNAPPAQYSLIEINVIASTSTILTSSSVSVTGAVAAGGAITTTATTPSTSTSTGSIVTAGGVGVAGNLNVGGTTSTISGTVGVGTSTVNAGNALAVFGGNIQIGTAGSSLRFPDGTMQTTAATGTSVAITNDTSTNASTYYPSLTNNVTSGTLSALVTSSTKLFYNPSTGALNSSVFIPSGSTAPTNGMYLPAANSVGWATNSTERMRVDQFGNVSIGTTSVAYGLNNRTSLTISGPTTSQIAWQQASTNLGYIMADGNMNMFADIGSLIMGTLQANPMRFWTNNTERMRINTLGNVGIGTTTISTGNTFAVFGGNIQIGTAGSSLRFPDGTMQTTAAAGASITITNDTTTNANTYYPSLTNNVTSGTLSGLTTSSTKLYYNPSTGALNSSVFIPSGSTAPTNGMYLPAADTVGWSTNSSERMRIDSSGNVGIGAAPYGTGLFLYRSIAGLLYSDIQNPSTANSSDGSVQRFITSDVAGSGTTSLDIVKYKSGAASIKNNETNSAAYLSFEMGTTERMRIDASGNVSIGTTSTVYKLDVTGNVRITSSLAVGSTTPSGTAGEIRATNNITAFYSDRRLKENIRTIENPLDKIKQISGVYYNSNDVAEQHGYTDRAEQVGVIAQEIQSVMPHAVKGAPFDTTFVDGKEVSISGEKYLTVQYEKLIPLLIESIKALTAEVEALKANQR